LEFDEYGAVLIVFGKTGMRRLRLINAASDLKAWKNAHPFKYDPDAPLWVSTKNTGRNSKPNAISYVAISEIIKNVARQVGIKKRMYPYNFRHSRATFLSKYLTDAELKNLLGHTQESRATAVYIHLSGKDIDDKLLKMYGIKKDSLKELTRSKPFIKCPRCKEVNDSGEVFCTKCWLPLTPQARRMAEVDKGVGLVPTMTEMIKKHPEIDPNIFWESVKINNKRTKKLLDDLENAMKRNEDLAKKLEEFENQKKKGK
jgi:integrase/recombinase XerD